MSRTVAALYDSRAEAEAARGRLISGVRPKSLRIIAKDTVGAVDGLRIHRKDKAKYRNALHDGSHLLVADVPAGANAKSIVSLLSEVGDSGRHEEPAPTGVYGDQTLVTEPARTADAARAAEMPSQPDRPAATAAPLEREPEAPRQELRSPEPSPQREEEVRIGKPAMARAGARVRSFIREAPAEEQVELREEIVELDRRPSERRLSDADIEAGGLFKERCLEIAEMREEPVVTKVAVVREEVIVRKRVEERTATVRDTVRRTQIETEDVSASGGDAPTFFGRRDDR
jgi:stress response protein YsnF